MSKFTRPGAKPPAPSAPAASAAPAAPSSKYKRSADVKVGADANYIRAGRFLFLVTRIEAGITPRSKEDFVSTHVTTLASDASERTPLEQRFGGALLREGEEANWFQKTKGDFFDQNMLKFAIAASNMTQEEISAAEQANNTTIVDEMIGPEQPFAGVVLEAHATLKINKKARDLGKPEATLTAEDVFTIVNWVRRVPYAELKELVEAPVLAKFLPDLDAKIAQEAQAG